MLQVTVACAQYTITW